MGLLSIGVPDKASMIVGIGHPGLQPEESTGTLVRLSEPGEAGRQWVEVRREQFMLLKPVANKQLYQAVRWKQGSADEVLTIKYRSNITVDRFPGLLPELSGLEIQPLAVIPGVKTVRLPFADEFMPTAIHWSPQGN